MTWTDLLQRLFTASAPFPAGGAGSLALALPRPAAILPAASEPRRRRPASAVAPRGATAELPIDEEAFARLYREVAEPLANYARRSLGDSDEARDISQEVFFRYLRAGLPAGTDPAVARPYLFRSASHLMRDRWRRGSRDRRWREQRPEVRAAEPRDRALATDLDRALGQLKPRDRALLWLAHVEGSSHREIAEALELGEGSIRVMLFRARKRLARLLENSDFPTEEWR